MEAATREPQELRVGPSLPSLDDLMGLDEQAETLAAAAANVVLMARRLEHLRVGNDDAEEDVVRGYAAEPDGEYRAKDGELLPGGVTAKAGERFRTYRQQRERCEKAVARFMAQAEEEEILGKVKERTQEKIKTSLEQEERIREAEIAKLAQGG